MRTDSAPDEPTARTGAAVPEPVIRRLPLYVRALGELVARGAELVSSSEIAALSGIGAAQVRRDLSYFGGFGRKGLGYDSRQLLGAVRGILHLDEEYRVVLVGAGPLGQAIARYGGFRENGFRLSWVYDHNEERIGAIFGELVVEDVARMPERVRAEGVRVAILAVPREAAQDVADQLVGSGVRAILNYAPVTLHVPPDVHIYDIDPVAALQSLAYYLSR